MSRDAVFLDRDGVLVDLVRDPSSKAFESALRADEVRLMPDAVLGARMLAQSGFVLVGVTNQPAAAKQQTTLVEILEVQSRVVALLEDQGVILDAWRLCLHHPQGTDPRLGVSCACRKPAPGMLLSAASELDIDFSGSWMIGDTDADVLAGSAAGCRTVQLEPPGSAHKRSTEIRPDMRAPNLLAAAKAVLAATSK